MKQGWEIKKLGEVCDLMNGYAFQSKNYTEEGYFVIRIGNVQDGIIELNNARYIQLNEEKQKKFILQSGDILISLTGNVGRVGIINESHLPAVINQRVAKITIKNEIKLNKDFIFYFLTSEYFISSLIKAGRGAAQQNISTTDIENLKIAFPTLSEQQQIVTILNEAFASIAKAKANAEQNLKNAKELFESYLQSVFENKGKIWEEKTLGEVAFVKSGGTPSRAKKEYWEGNIAWYSSGELNELYTKDPERNINELAINNSNAKIFPKGSLLIGMYDTAALKMSIIDRDATFNQAIAGVKPNEKIDLIFILHSINSIKPDLLNLRRGVRQKNLSLEKIKNIPIFLPTINEQKAIVQKLDALSTETKKLEAIYQQKINDLEELKKSILQKAFIGELKTEKTIA